MAIYIFQFIIRIVTFNLDTICIENSKTITKTILKLLVASRKIIYKAWTYGQKENVNVNIQRMK